MARGRRSRVEEEEEEEEEDQEDQDEEEDDDAKPQSKKKTPPKKKGRSSDAEETTVPAPVVQVKPTKFAYTDVHRSILQYMMMKKVVEEKQLEQVSLKLGRNSKTSLDQLLREINEKLLNENLSLQIRQRDMLEDEKGEKMWGLVSTRNDEISKLGTSLEPWQLALFNGCLMMLAKAEDGTFTHTEAIEAGKQQQINKTGNEVLRELQKLTALGWLRETRKHFWTAGPRTLLELSEVLREYGAEECPLTKQIVITTRPYKEWLKASSKPQAQAQEAS